MFQEKGKKTKLTTKKLTTLQTHHIHHSTYTSLSAALLLNNPIRTVKRLIHELFLVYYVFKG